MRQKREILLRVTEKWDARWFYFNTDYVFDGTGFTAESIQVKKEIQKMELTVGHKEYLIETYP